MYALGGTVYPANPGDMLHLCDAYNSHVTHGIVVDVRPEYAASVLVLWFVGDEAQTVAYALEPTQLTTH